LEVLLETHKRILNTFLVKRHIIKVVAIGFEWKKSVESWLLISFG